MPASAARIRINPCGTANSGPRWPPCAALNSRGHAIAVAISINTAPIVAPVSGARCHVSAPVMKAAPAKPPTLYIPWKPDISGRGAERSTSTACTFMATSHDPIAAPKRSKARPSVTGVDAKASVGNRSAAATAAKPITGRLP